MSRLLRIVGYCLLVLFAVIGFFLTVGFFAVKFGFTNTSGIIDDQRSAFLHGTTTEKTVIAEPVWSKSEEWLVLEEAVLRDKSSIKRAGEMTGVSPRLIVAQLVVEQLRLFHSNRELFKTAFAPLRLLGNQSQFSWGVVGIKEETAIAIEGHLKDSRSPFYPGEKYESLLDWKTNDHGKERFDRIINEHDRYYSYLYAGLYMKEVLTQWKNSGFDISDRPDILSTLYNIGFEHSSPNADPKSGGAEIRIGTSTYSYGALAGEFYESNLLIEDFPRGVASN